MRVKTLTLAVLLVLTIFVCGCAVDMSSKAPKTGHKTYQHHPVIKPTVAHASDRQGAYVLVRHEDGFYYVIDTKQASARKVGGIEPCKK